MHSVTGKALWGFIAGVFALDVSLYLRNASRTNKTEWSRIVRVAQRQASTGVRLVVHTLTQTACFLQKRQFPPVTSFF